MMKHLVIWAVVTVLLSSCAQMAPLTGGPKDGYAPVPEDANVYPPNYSTHFNSKGIIIEFNEYFKLEQTQSISINPGVDKEPKFKVKGKRLFIELDADLEENTTYSINFGNAIKDITEGNILKNFKYVFSTGEYIDSLEYRGTVYRAEDNLPVEGAIVGLYKAQGDSVPYISQPNYIGITNSGGWFSIENVKEGTYKVIALSDENGDYLFDESSESIAFLKEDVVIDSISDDASMVDLHLFQMPPAKLNYIEKTGYKDGIAKVVFNKPVEEGSIELLAPDDIEEEIWSPRRDSLLIYTRFPKQKLQFALIRQNGIKDTVTVSLNKDLPKFTLARIPKGHDHREDLVVTFTNVVSEFFEEDIDLVKDSIRLPITIRTNPQVPNSIIINGNYKINSTYQLSFDSASVEDIAGRGIPTSSFSFTTYKENYYGSLSLNVITASQSNMFIQLLDEQQKVVRTSDSFYGAEAIDFPDLPPGKYTARLIFDRNFNNMWDPGNYLGKVLPEKVVNYGTVLVVRSNWDLNENWEIDLRD